MCGIVGSVNNKFDHNILDLILHRGPDDGDIQNIKISNNHICLGHRRLSIQDLSTAGHQPMKSHCGNYIIIFNCEIYNHLDLREKLKDINFKGHSDTETIVNYIAKFGIKSVKKFNGIFAFSLLDIKNEKIYLVRDRFGVKPLYYNKENNSFCYSSEVKPILKLTGKKDINIDSLNEFLTMRFNSAPKTIFNAIYKLIPGETLEYNIKTKTLNKLFNINTEYISSINIDSSKSENYWIESLSEHLEQAVERQMLSDVEVGSFLSGGLDSALLTKIASKYSNNKIKTFCVGFKNAKKKDDEIKESIISSKILDTEHRHIIIDPNDYYDKYLKKSMYMLEEPNGSAATFAQYEVSKLASKYVKVALAGQGADEILYGYPKFYAEIQRKKFALPLSIISKFQSSLKYLNNHRLNRLIYAMGENNEFKRYIKTREVFNNMEKSLLMKDYRDIRINSFDPYFSSLNPNIYSVDKFAIADTYTQLADELLMYGDKTTMATSLEMRVPFLDNDLVKLVHKIPYHLKVKSGNQKYILKKVAEKHLPNEIIYRKKKGFVMPILDWFQNDLQDKLIIDLVEKDAFVHRYIKKEGIKQLIENYKNKEEKDYRKLLLVLHFNSFGEVYEKFN